jgi:hypothetical protein
MHKQHKARTDNADQGKRCKIRTRHHTPSATSNKATKTRLRLGKLTTHKAKKGKWNSLKRTQVCKKPSNKLIIPIYTILYTSTLLFILNEFLFILVSFLCNLFLYSTLLFNLNELYSYFNDI